MQQLAILGSTGSIGVNALNVARHLSDQFKVTTLAAGRNIDLLEQQIHEFSPEVVAVYDEQAAKELKGRLSGTTRVVAGMEGLLEVAAYDGVDFVVSAITGTIGLQPTLAAIEAGKNVGLANKESLVSGGELVMKRVKEKGVNLLPIDSEHSALFQSLHSGKKSEVQRLILTASGGPFRSHTAEQLQQVTADEALNHPNWKMGPKVTVDSSTLMNKGLEVIEAHWLFDIPMEKIDVVVHPQSIIHSMVEFNDGSIIAQMGEPDMIVPIQYAMTYPDRLPGTLPRFDFTKSRSLEFHQPDRLKFRCLQLAFDAIHEGGSLPCYMNAANEVLVDRFLARQIEWHEIGTTLENLMTRHQIQRNLDLESLLAIDSLARTEAANT